MKSFLLLILSLMTGCEASSELKGCREGWVEFTCKYPKRNTVYQRIYVVTPKKATIPSTQQDVWENKGRLSLYHDTKDKKLRVAIKQLQQENFGKYECKFDHDSPEENDEVEIKVERVGCQTPFVQTAYRTAKTTITCDYSGNKYKFFCKDNGFICEDFLSTKSSPKSNGTFTLTETNSNFSMSISNVASHDAGVYWCGVEEKRGSYRGALRKIHLQVEDITTSTMSPTVGQTVTYWCRYPNGSPIKKFICKGEDPSTCRPLINTTQLNKNTGKFSIKDDKVKQNVTITVREVTTDNTGTYWCGAETPNKTHSNPFYHRLVMTVDDSWLTVATAAVGCVVFVLVLVLILVLVYKRFKCSKNSRNAKGQENKEERAYEEIQERPQKPDSGTALKTIYTTANFPTNPSASHHYANTNFQNSSGEVGGDTYPTVRDNARCPTYSTVGHPPGLPQDPFYSTANMPLQHWGQS